jgi:hypothetical protein
MTEEFNIIASKTCGFPKDVKVTKVLVLADDRTDAYYLDVYYVMDDITHNFTVRIFPRLSTAIDYVIWYIKDMYTRYHEVKA